MTLTGVGVGFAIEWYLRVLIVAIYMILGAAKLPLELLLCSPLPLLVIVKERQADTCSPSSMLARKRHGFETFVVLQPFGLG